jgi:plasmid stabilization system protein ParE
MRMDEALSRGPGDSLVDELASALSVPPSRAAAALGETEAALSWHLERLSLSRGGLADLVELLCGGQHAQYLHAGHALRDPSAREHGEAILVQLLGSLERSGAMAARVAHRTGISRQSIAAMLPELVAAALARTALRVDTVLKDILSKVPPQGRFSRGTAQADLADILRRRCGAGPYAPRRLRREVRAAIARAADFPRRGAIGWYLQFVLLRLFGYLRSRPRG